MSCFPYVYKTDVHYSLSIPTDNKTCLIKDCKLNGNKKCKNNLCAWNFCEKHYDHEHYMCAAVTGDKNVINMVHME